MPRLNSMLAAQVPPCITDRDFWDRCSEEPLHAEWRDTILAAAEVAAAEPPQLSASSMLACRRNNDRSASDRIHGQLNTTVSALVTRRCLLGMSKHDDRLLDWLWALAHCSTWALTCHLPEQQLPRADRVCIDLGAAMSGVLLAESCEQLRPWLDRQDTHLADTICDQLETRICRPFGQGHVEWWADPETCYNNWTGVCAGGIAAIACSLGRQGRPQPAAYERALLLLDAYLQRGFTPGGECDEGVGYWSYGMHYLCLGLSRMPQDELERRIDLERLKLVARYPQRCRLFHGCHYAANDGSSGFRIHPVIGANLAAICDDAHLHRLAAEENVARFLSDHGTPTWRMVRAREALAAEATPADDETTGDAWLPDQQAALWRAVPGEARLCCTFAGGHNGECHNHNDLGQVNLWCDRKPVLIDLGAPKYTADFFGPHRYEQLAAASRGHNVPLIDGHEQRAGSEARTEVIDAMSDEGCCLELAAAYPAEAGCRSWLRRLRFADGAVIVEDRAELRPGATVELRWWTTRDISLDGTAATIGSLRVATNASALHMISERAADHRLRIGNEDTMIRCLVCAAVADENGMLSVDCRFAAL